MILGILVIAVGAVAFGIVRRARMPSFQRTAVEQLARDTFLREVSGTGVVEATQERSLTFEGSSTVAEILVNEGDRVERGTLLARQDTSSLERELASSQANLQSAQADLQRILAQQQADRLDARNSTVSAEGALANAQTEVRDAGDTLATTRELNTIGATSRDELDAAEEAQAQAQRRLDQAQLSLDSAREREAAFDQLAAAQRASGEATVASLQTTIANHAQRIAEANMVASFAGTVTTIDFKVGERVEPLSQDAIRLVDTSSLWVTADFTENRAVDLVVGQAATIIPDANQRQRFGGVVERIGATARQTEGAAQVEVVFRFSDSARDAIDQGLIKPGFNVDVRVVVNRLEDVTLIPLQAISEAGGETWLYQILEVEPGQGTVERVTIEILDQNNTEAAVASSSLDEGSLIALLNLDELESGQDVQYDPVAGEATDAS